MEGFKVVRHSGTWVSFENNLLRCEAYSTLTPHYTTESDYATICKQIGVPLRDHLINYGGYNIPKGVCVYQYMLENNIMFELNMRYLDDEQVKTLAEYRKRRGLSPWEPPREMAAYKCMPVYTAMGVHMAWYMYLEAQQVVNALEPRGRDNYDDGDMFIVVPRSNLYDLIIIEELLYGEEISYADTQEIDFDEMKS